MKILFHKNESPAAVNECAFETEIEEDQDLGVPERFVNQMLTCEVEGRHPPR